MYPPRPGEWVFARTRAVRRFEVEGAPPYGHGPVAAKSARGMRAAAMPRTWKKLANGRFWFSNLEFSIVNFFSRGSSRITNRKLPIGRVNSRIDPENDRKKAALRSARRLSFTRDG